MNVSRHQSKKLETSNNNRGVSSRTATHIHYWFVAGLACCTPSFNASNCFDRNAS
jgi:hypothetical protein